MTLEGLEAAAIALREGVDAGQRNELCLPFDDHERRTWFYWPAPRRGLLLGALDGERRQLVDDLLTAWVATPTLAKVMTIIGLEVVLADLEGQGLSSRRRGTGLPRDPSAYTTTIFGEPGRDTPWGLRFEGHHVSLHATLVDGRLAPTPLFLGSNPALVEHDGRLVMRPLAEEEDVARALLGSLDTSARRRALIDDTAPDDIVTANAPAVDHNLVGGVALADLKGEAASIAASLVRVYVERCRAGVTVPDYRDLHFAWAGDPERGRPHYYRLSGSRFLAEYDNTQNEANHAHSVWRDPRDDFGQDLLRGHRATQH